MLKRKSPSKKVPVKIDHGREKPILDTSGRIINDVYSDDKELEAAINNAILDFMDKDEDSYLGMASDYGWMAVAKRKKLSVTSVNNNPTFQPFESTKTRDYCVLVVVLWSNEPEKNTFGDRLIRMGCPIVLINGVGEVERKFKEI